MGSVGFKEWAIVCEALGRGDQTVILRKGGIAEGRGGFTFEHREFFLFPTLFHEQLASTRLTSAELPPPRDGQIELKYFATVEKTETLASWNEVAALEPLHVLRPEIVRERFEYGTRPVLHVAFVRVEQLVRPWVIPDAPEYGGCRSWVTLPDCPPELCVSLSTRGLSSGAAETAKDLTKGRR